jgi:hypothetical protein
LDLLRLLFGGDAQSNVGLSRESQYGHSGLQSTGFGQACD